MKKYEKIFFLENCLSLSGTNSIIYNTQLQSNLSLKDTCIKKSLSIKDTLNFPINEEPHQWCNG